MRWFPSLSLLLLAAWALAPGAWGQQGEPREIEVRVLPQAEVFGDVFTLGEIAEMDGFDLKALARLAKVEVGASPLPGRTVGVNAAMLRSRIGAADRKARFRLLVPPGARVIRAAQVLSAETIREAVLAQARQHASLEKKAELVQEVSTPLSDVVVPKGEIALDVVLLGKHLVAGGNRAYRVTVRVNGQESWKTTVRVRQSVFQQVVVAKRSIRRHQRIARGDLTLARKNISDNRGDPYLTSFDKVVGRYAKRPVGKTQALHASLLRKPADVPEGGRVTVIYDSGRLVLRAPGVAMVQGRTGQFIPVKNLQSGKIVHGILQEDETVKVN
jgi:flagella basal body P-ring formation protein FlgA